MSFDKNKCFQLIVLMAQTIVAVVQNQPPGHPHLSLRARRQVSMQKDVGVLAFSGFSILAILDSKQPRWPTLLQEYLTDEA